MSEAYAIVKSSAAIDLLPVLTLEQALSRFTQIGEFARTVLKENIDYGKIPGTDRRTLLKPGAEKLNGLFGLVPTFEAVTTIEDFTGAASGGSPLFFYRIKCKLWRGAPSLNMLAAEGIGSCNSREKKYRWRRQEKTCPKCNKPAIRRGDGGRDSLYYCFAKVGGCGARFYDGERDAAAVEQIKAQPDGQIENPDICDLINTLDKIAQKRAMIAATLIGTGASEFFTQDLDDFLVEPAPANGNGDPADAKQPEGNQGEAADNTDQRPEGEKKPGRGRPRKDTTKPAPAAQEPAAEEQTQTAASEPETQHEPARIVWANNNAFRDEFRRVCAFRLGFTEAEADGLLGKAAVSKGFAKLSDIPVDKRPGWIAALEEGQADHKRKADHVWPPAEGSGGNDGGEGLSSPAASGGAHNPTPQASGSSAPAADMSKAPAMPDWAKPLKPGDPITLILGKRHWQTSARSLPLVVDGEWMIYVEGMTEPYPFNLVVPPEPVKATRKGKSATKKEDAPAAGRKIPAEVTALTPLEDAVSTWDKFSALWDDGAQVLKWSIEEAAKCLNMALMLICRKGKEESTTTAWRRETIGYLRADLLDKATGTIKKPA